MKYSVDVVLRVIGSALVILSYFVILHISTSLGAIMMFIARSSLRAGKISSSMGCLD